VRRALIDFAYPSMGAYRPMCEKAKFSIGEGNYKRGKLLAR
jgi:hypothetical protein